MTAPPDTVIALAKAQAELSPCRSRRGVVLYHEPSLRIVGAGFNAPPRPFTCPGREVCAGKCGEFSVHAEMRALNVAEPLTLRSASLDLVHVELDPAGSIVACDGPSCARCSAWIVERRFVAGVWLYEAEPRERCEDGWSGSYGHRSEASEPTCQKCGGSGHLGPLVAAWRYRTAEEFHQTTLRNRGLEP